MVGSEISLLASLLLIPRVITEAALLETLGHSTSQEFCHNEVFQAHCEQNEVIVMEKAIYGRMRLGKCVKTDLGYLGCSDDLLPIADSMCSGRSKCAISIPNEHFDSSQVNCLPELKSYFEASYACVEVQSVESEVCPHMDTVNLTATQGVISSYTSAYSLCGTRDHPWLIMARPGQRVNLTLYDFTVEPMHQSAHYPTHSQPLVCQKYGFVEDYSGDCCHETRICGGATRVSNVLLSEGHAVKLWLEHMKIAKKMHHFLIEYEVIGCPDIEPPENTWFMRVYDKAEMGCAYTDTKWVMECVGHEWIGEQGNCSKPHHEKTFNSGKNKGTISYGIAVVIILGAAFLVGFIIVLIGLLLRYRRRRDKNRHHSRGRETMPLRPKPDTDVSAKPSTSHQALPQQSSQTVEESNKANYMLPKAASARRPRPVKIDGNEYEHIWESPLPTPRGSSTIPRRAQQGTSSTGTYTKYKPEGKQTREKPQYLTSRDIVEIKGGHLDTGRYSPLARSARRDHDLQQ